MALLSFCGVLTLQVGTAILATVFLTLGCIIAMVNCLDYSDSYDGWVIPLIIIVVFVIIMLVIGIIMFFTAYNESRKLCIVSIVLIVLLLISWIILSCLSFLNNPDFLKIICEYDRCPESFWISDLSYRGAWRPYNITSRGFEKYGLQNKGMNMMANLSPGFLEDTNSLHWHDGSINVQGGLNHATSTPRYEFGKELVGAILIFVANLVFLLFSIIILWSYAQELKWMTYFYQNPSGSNVGPNA